MIVNTQLLEEKIESSGLKKGFICEQMGVSRQALDRKIKGSIPFRASEIYVVCDLTKITNEERIKIFCNEVD